MLMLVAVVTMAFTLKNTPQIKLRMAESAISEYYVDSVDEDKLVEAAIRGMLKDLDPHSTYSTAEETRDLNESLQGNFSGIGITFNILGDTLYVIQTISGGPSDKVGILAGDRIIEVNDTTVAGVGMKNTEIRKRLRGPKGTHVDVKVLRGTGKNAEEIDFSITRDIIPVKSVDVAYMANPTTGYIRLNKYAKDTPDEVLEAMRKLRKQGMKDLILDLTDNGGGYLNAAVDLVSEFIPKEKLVVYTQGNTVGKYEHYSKPSGKVPQFEDGRLVVMVNQYTASAAEITSGAIQDWDRGVIVGRRSYGKGLVQRPFPFPDGSMMRLTIAHYYTPTGRDIQRPYTKGDQKSYDDDIMNRLKSGELMHQDSIHYADSLKTETLIKHRVIYGGGGISPDLFVPLDTMENTKYYRSVMAKGLLNRYAARYVDQNRKQLKKRYVNTLGFVRNFAVTDKMLEELVAMADAEKIERNEEELKQSSKLFKDMVKALIGRDTFGEEAFYRVVNERNPIYTESLRVIGSEEYDKLLRGNMKSPDYEIESFDIIDL